MSSFTFKKETIKDELTQTLVEPFHEVSSEGGQLGTYEKISSVKVLLSDK